MGERAIETRIAEVFESIDPFAALLFILVCFFCIATGALVGLSYSQITSDRLRRNLSKRVEKGFLEINTELAEINQKLSERDCEGS